MTEIDAERAAEIHASFARQSLMRTFNATLERLGPGFCRISAPVTEAVLQQHGVAHGGLTFALGDSAAGYAALTLRALGDEVMTVEMKINMTAPAQGPRLVAEGRVARSGRRLSVVQAEIFGGPDLTSVALLQGTMIPVRPSG